MKCSVSNEGGLKGRWRERVSDERKNKNKGEKVAEEGKLFKEGEER